MSTRLVQLTVLSQLVRFTATFIRANCIGAVAQPLVLSTAVPIQTLVDIGAIEAVPLETGSTPTRHVVIGVRSTISILVTLDRLADVGPIDAGGRDGAVPVEPGLIRRVEVAIPVHAAAIRDWDTGKVQQIRIVDYIIRIAFTAFETAWKFGICRYLAEKRAL